MAHAPAPVASRRFPLAAALPVAVSFVLATSPLLFARHKQREYSSPRLVTAASINYPINSGASGVVAVAIYLDSDGNVKGTDTLRDIPSLTSPVLLSIPKWTFKPAMLDGQPVDSTIVASIAFNPADYRLGGSDTPPLGMELKALSPDERGFLPPKVLTAAWAPYPINSVAQGAVVLDAHVNSAGNVTHVSAVWNNPSLTNPSIEAAKRWTFAPASFDRKAITVNAIIGYVFRPPNIANPGARP